MDGPAAAVVLLRAVERRRRDPRRVAAVRIVQQQLGLVVAQGEADGAVRAASALQRAAAARRPEFQEQTCVIKVVIQE